MTTTFLLRQLLIKLDGPKLFFRFVFRLSILRFLHVSYFSSLDILGQGIYHFWWMALSLVPVKTELVQGFCFLSSSRSILVADKIGDSPIKSDINSTTSALAGAKSQRDHTTCPKTAKNGTSYSTVPKRNMGRSVFRNLVQCVNVQNARRAWSSYTHYPCISPADATRRCYSRSCTDNTSVLGFWGFAGIELTTHETKVPHSDQLSLFNLVSDIHI